MSLNDYIDQGHCSDCCYGSNELLILLMTEITKLLFLHLLRVCYRKLHCSMGKQNNVLHCQCIWSRFLIGWSWCLLFNETCLLYILFPWLLWTWRDSIL